MKSISAIAEGVLNDLPNTAPSLDTRTVSLPSRPSPLSTAEIATLEDAIERHMTVKRDARYGYVPVLGDDAELIRQEYDVVGEDVAYQPKGDTPRSLFEAMIRPAKREHIVYHLGRLAAHRRDSRGREALEVVLQDIASDMCGVSEYAVVLACVEMRRKNSTWFPNTGEIEQIIRRYDQKMADLARIPLSGIAQVKPKQIAADPRINMHWKDIKDKKNWLPQHWQWYVGDAEYMIKYFREQGRRIEADQAQVEFERRTTEVQKAAA